MRSASSAPASSSTSTSDKQPQVIAAERKEQTSITVFGNLRNGAFFSGFIAGACAAVDTFSCAALGHSNVAVTVVVAVLGAISLGFWAGARAYKPRLEAAQINLVDTRRQIRDTFDFEREVARFA